MTSATTTVRTRKLQDQVFSSQSKTHICGVQCGKIKTDTESNSTNDVKHSSSDA